MGQFSILLKSDLERERIDADFYLPRYLGTIRALRRIPHAELGSRNLVTSGSTPPDRDESLKEGVILLKTQNIQDGFIDLSNDVFYIDERHDEQLKSTRLKPKDILLNIVGATLEVIGRVVIVPQEFPRANITQAMALIRISSNEFLPEYVFAFLFSKFGRIQVSRFARPTGQFNVNHQEIRAIIIPLMLHSFQISITDLVNKSIAFRQQSKIFREQAERKILDTFRFEEMPKHFRLSYLANLINCLNNHRIDPEFYRPEYEQIWNKVSEVAETNGWQIKSVRDLSEPLRYGTSEDFVYLDKGIPFLRISDMKNMDFDEETLHRLSDNDVARAGVCKS